MTPPCRLILMLRQLTDPQLTVGDLDAEKKSLLRQKWDMEK